MTRTGNIKTMLSSMPHHLLAVIIAAFTFSCENIDEDSLRDEFAAANTSTVSEEIGSPPTPGDTNDNETNTPDTPVIPELPELPACDCVQGTLYSADGIIPLVGIEVYVAGDYDSRRKTDEYGYFKIDKQYESKYELIVADYANNRGKLISNLEGPFSKQGIRVEPLGTLKGSFVQNAEDSATATAREKLKYLDYGKVDIEVWSVNEEATAPHYVGKMESDGTFTLRGIAPGDWVIKYKMEDDVLNPTVSSLPTMTYTVEADKVTQTMRGSIAKFDDNTIYAASLGDVIQNDTTKQISVIDVSKNQIWTEILYTFFDENNDIIGTESTSTYEEEKFLDIPVGAYTLIVKYKNATDESGSFNFSINLNDTDGDGFSAMIDCDDTDSDVFRYFTHLAKDQDGDKRYVLQTKEVCGGDEIPEGYVKYNKNQLMDCDDTDPFRQFLFGTENRDTGERYFECSSRDLGHKDGYREPGGEFYAGSSMQFTTDPDKADIIYFSIYVIDEEAPETAEIILPELKKETYIVLVSYDYTNQWLIKTNGGEEHLKAVFVQSYGVPEDADKYPAGDAATVIDSLGNKVTSTTISHEFKTSTYSSGSDISAFWNTTNISGERNSYSRSFREIPLLFGGQIKYFYDDYDPNSNHRLDLILKD